MSDLHIPDLSEYQSTVDWSTLAKARPAVILRAHNGYRADRQFAARLVQARRYEQVRLFYGFMVADRDAATQARELAATVGQLQPGEAFVCDAETGAGDQSARVKAYLAALAGRDIVYSGDSFAHDHLATELQAKGLLFWDAAYRSTEPTTHHFLWQHTDHEPTPGVGNTDCSIFHGTVQQLRDLISPAAPAPAQAPAPKPTPPPAPAAQPHPSPAHQEAPVLFIAVRSDHTHFLVEMTLAGLAKRAISPAQERVYRAGGVQSASLALTDADLAAIPDAS